MPIPGAYRAICEFCGHELDTREGGVHQHISGWAMNRKGGGAHGEADQEDQPP